MIPGLPRTPELAALERVVADAKRVSLCDSNRLGALLQAALSVADDGGDMIELGVYKGGSALLLAHAVARTILGKLHLLDSWKGLPALAPEDRGSVLPAGTFGQGDPAKECRSLLERHNLAERVELHPGLVTETLPTVPGPFTFAHVDLDLYAGTRFALSYLLPRMTARGIIFVDDYGNGKRRFPGVEKAVSEVLRESGWFVALLVGERDQAAVLHRVRPSAAPPST